MCCSILKYMDGPASCLRGGWDPETELGTTVESRARSPARTSHVVLQHLRPLAVAQNPKSLDQVWRWLPHTAERMLHVLKHEDTEEVLPSCRCGKHKEFLTCYRGRHIILARSVFQEPCEHLQPTACEEVVSRTIGLSAACLTRLSASDDFLNESNIATTRSLS
jgi:hypothetical protein